MEQSNHLKAVRSHPIHASVDDIHNLVTATAKLQERHSIQEPYPSPQETPLPEPRRAAEVLDSLASLCVSKPQEVLATALRVNDRDKSVELIFTGNEDIQDATYDHVKEIWTGLKRISARRHQLRPQDIHDEELEREQNIFAYTCLSFHFEKLKSRVNAEFAPFCAIDTDNLDSAHPFHNLRQSIITIEELYTRDDDAKVGRPSNPASWKTMFKCLRIAKDETEDFWSSGGFGADTEDRIAHFPDFKRYIDDIASTMRKVGVLTILACSRRTRHLFEYEFTVITIPPERTTVEYTLQTANDWERVLEKALMKINYLSQFFAQEYVMDIRQIKGDAEYISRQTPDHPCTHSEVTILLHPLQSDTDKDTPKVYPYIGLSEIPCVGCQAFFEAINGVCSTNYKMRPSNSTSTRPWLFPQICLHRKSVIETMYQILAAGLLKWYPGYRPKPAQSDPIPKPTVPFESGVGYFTEDERDNLHREGLENMNADQSQW